MIADMHVHTRWSSDSAVPVNEQVERAIALGMKTICITDHQDFDAPRFPPDYFTFLVDDRGADEAISEYMADLTIMRYSDSISRLSIKYKCFPSKIYNTKGFGHDDLCPKPFDIFAGGLVCNLAGNQFADVLAQLNRIFYGQSGNEHSLAVEKVAVSLY